MIQALGTSPISGITKAGMSEFLSLLRPKPSKAFGDDPGRSSRAYVNTRGILINKDFLKGSSTDLTRGYQFQFNPDTISDIKEAVYENRTYMGLPYQDYIWGGGGQRTISFQLFLDDTPHSHIRSFRPTSIGGKDAPSIRLADKYGQGVSGYEAFEQEVMRGKRSSFKEEVSSQWRTIKSSFKPTPGPSSFEWDNNGSYSHSRTRERGVLDDVELIQSFLYPAPLVGEGTPKFAEGGVVSMNQFRPPTIAVLCVGPLYLEGVVKAAPVKYSLFDHDLCPIRATIELEFSVNEFAEVTRRINWNNK